MLHTALQITDWDMFSAQATYLKTTDTASDIVQFTQVDFNYAQSFNGSVFHPKTNGYFFFHLSYGKQRNDLLTAELRNADNVVLTQLQAPPLPGRHSFSVNHLVQLNRDQSVHVTSSTPVNYNITHLLPTLVGFHFDNLTMKPFIAWQQEYYAYAIKYFFAFKQSNNSNNSIEVNFNKSTTTDTQIRVPVSGIYVISMTVAARHMFSPQYPDGSVSVEITNANDKIDWSKLFVMRFSSKNLSGDYNLTMSLFYLLHISTTEHVEPSCHRLSKSTSQAKLTLQLLLYSPAHGKQVAWAMRLSHPSTMRSRLFERHSCLINVCINVNVSCQDGVDLNNLTASNRVNVIHAGQYYIVLTLEFVSSYDDDANVCVRVTKPSTATVQFLMCTENLAKSEFRYSDHRAVIWRLDANDEVSVYGEVHLEIFFTGFLLSSS
jgi:hypothetical protein